MRNLKTHYMKRALNNKLTWEKLLPILPLINVRELERRVGLRQRRIADVKDKRSTLKPEELEKIQSVLSFFK